jgi:hypothetical protein
MKVDDVLSVLAVLGPLVPYPPLATLVPILVQLARDLERSGILDTSAPVDLATIGKRCYPIPQSSPFGLGHVANKSIAQKLAN